MRVCVAETSDIENISAASTFGVSAIPLSHCVRSAVPMSFIAHPTRGHGTYEYLGNAPGIERANDAHLRISPIASYSNTDRSVGGLRNRAAHNSEIDISV